MLSGSSFHSFILLGKNMLLYIFPRMLGLISVACDLVLYLCDGVRKCAGIVIAFLPFKLSRRIFLNGDMFFVQTAHNSVTFVICTLLSSELCQ